MQRRIVILYRRFGQRIGTIFKGQEVQEEKKADVLDILTIEDGTDALSRNVGKR
jgi:hypothetical protein